MSATVQELEKHVIVPPDRRLTITIELPPEFPEGEAVMTLTSESSVKHKMSRADLFGAGKDDHVWMSDDFDEPLEDFKDYM